MTVRYVLLFRHVWLQTTAVFYLPLCQMCTWVGVFTHLPDFQIGCCIICQIRRKLKKTKESEYSGSCLPSPTQYYIHLLHGSSQRCGTLRSFGDELFFNNDRCYAYNDRCQGKSCLSYHSASSPVTYPPAYSVAKRWQRLRRTISLLINTTNAGEK